MKEKCSGAVNVAEQRDERVEHHSVCGHWLTWHSLVCYVFRRNIRVCLKAPGEEKKTKAMNSSDIGAQN